MAAYGSHRLVASISSRKHRSRYLDLASIASSGKDDAADRAIINIEGSISVIEMGSLRFSDSALPH